MKLIKASYKIESPIDGLSILKAIEKAGRTCYKSEDKITDDSCTKFVEMLIRQRTRKCFRTSINICEVCC